MLLSRRAFLASGLAAYAVAQTALIDSNSHYVQLVTNAVKGKLTDLHIDPVGLNQFAKDFVHRYQKGGMRVLMIAAAFQAKELPFATLVRKRLAPFERMSCELYLLSSDYFYRQRRADESLQSEPIRYIGFYDPYTRPCSNPIAQLT